MDPKVECPHCGTAQREDNIFYYTDGGVAEIDCPECGPVDLDPVDPGPDREDVRECEERYWHR